MATQVPIKTALRFRKKGYILAGQVTLVGGKPVKVVGVLSVQTVPELPTGLVLLEVSNALVRFSWSDSSNAHSWEIYRGGVLHATTAVPDYTDNTVAPSTPYTYTVVAVNTAGSSDQSDEFLSVVTLGGGAIPAVPTGLAAGTVTRSQAAIQWLEVGDASAWDVFRGGVFKATVLAPSYVDMTVAPGTAYTYTVLARNATGDSAQSGGLVVNTPANILPVWGDLTHSATVGVAFSLDLNTVCSDADGDVLSYAVVTALPPGLVLNGSQISGTPTASGSPTSTLSASDGLATVEADLLFSIAAAPDTTGPSAPVISASVAGSTVTIGLVTPATDASGIRQYNMRRKAPGATVFSFRAVVLPTEFPYIDSGLANGTYEYQCRAEDNATPPNQGTMSSDVSIEVGLISSAPDTPTVFRVFRVSNTQIDSTWQAGPGGAPTTSFEMDRSLTGANAQTPGAAGWTNVYTGSALAFSNTGLANSTTYHYRIRAFAGAVPSAAYAVASTSTATVVTYGSSFDEYSIASWRNTDDTIVGWDWSCPPTHTVESFSGHWLFGGSTTFPAGYPGNIVTRINIDWADCEQTEGNFNFSAVTTKVNNADHVEIDVFGSTRTNSSPNGRVTCPGWLQAKLPTQGVHWINESGGAMEGTAYLPYHPTLTIAQGGVSQWQVWHKKFTDALFGENCASYPTGYRIGGYKLHEHPKVKFNLIHGWGGNVEEFTGSIYSAISGNADYADHVLTWFQNWKDTFGAQAYKCAFVGHGRPWLTLAKPILDMGLGLRGSEAERWLAWSYTPQYKDAPAGISLEEYTGSPGGDPYRCYMKLTETDARMNPSLPARHQQNQNEFYKFTSNTAGGAIASPAGRYQQNYRYSMLRGVAMRFNSMAIEPPNTKFNNYGGISGALNPKILAWTAYQQGKTYANAPEAFCALIRSYARSHNQLTGANVGNLEVNNIEYLLKQRDTYGATTVDKKRGHGISPSDSDWNNNANDSHGEGTWEWTPAFMEDVTKFPKSLWYLWLARKGTQIGFELNSVFIPGTRAVAIKVVYMNEGNETWKVRYKNNVGATVDTSFGNTNTGKVMTATVFAPNFTRQTSGASLWLISNATTPFMFVRVVKT